MRIDELLEELRAEVREMDPARAQMIGEALEQLAREVRSSSSGCADEDDDLVVGSYEWVMGTD